MKKIDLNIDLGKQIKGEDGKEMKASEMAKKWIGVMLERALNKPDSKTGRPTVSSGMEVQRKYFKVMNAIDNVKDGIVEMDDDDFSFLDRKFHQAEMPVQKDVTELLIKIDDAINKAKVGNG